MHLSMHAHLLFLLFAAILNSGSSAPVGPPQNRQGASRPSSEFSAQQSIMMSYRLNDPYGRFTTQAMATRANGREWKFIVKLPLGGPGIGDQRPSPDRPREHPETTLLPRIVGGREPEPIHPNASTRSRNSETVPLPKGLPLPADSMPGILPSKPQNTSYSCEPRTRSVLWPNNPRYACPLQRASQVGLSVKDARKATLPQQPVNLSIIQWHYPDRRALESPTRSSVRGLPSVAEVEALARRIPEESLKIASLPSVTNTSSERMSVTFLNSQEPINAPYTMPKNK